MIGFAKAAAAAAIEEKSFNLDLLCSLNSLAPHPLRAPPPSSLSLPPKNKQLAPHLEAQRSAKVPLALRGWQARAPSRDDDGAEGDR